uniref:hypothetical protein n=2 Tax=Roseivirga sp. TaxID=1964215 RepID=UPI004047A62A
MSTNRRNRRKKERQKKKPRFVGLEFNLDGIPKEELESLKIGIKKNSNGIEALIKTDKREIQTHSVKGYRRENKSGFNLKKTNHISSSSQMGIPQNLFEFDVIIGIDTNSKIIENINHHVGIASQILLDKSSTKSEPEIYFETIKLLHVTGEIDKPENVNWKNLIEFILNHPHYSTSKKYVIVVDSDLGELNNYNARTKPIIQNYFLPDNFQLTYSSSDANNDEISNQLIAFCDKIANQALDEIKNNSL